MDGQKAILSHSALYALAGHTASVNSLAWSSEGGLLASGSDDRTVRLWNGQTGALSLLLPFTGHTDMVISVAWSPEGGILASGSRDRTVRLWEGQSGQCLHTLKGHTDTIWSLVWSPDGQLFVSQSYDGTVRLWRTPSWETVEILEDISSRVLNALAFHPRAPILTTLDKGDTALHLWKVNVAALLAAAPVTPAVHSSL